MLVVRLCTDPIREVIDAENETSSRHGCAVQGQDGDDSEAGQSAAGGGVCRGAPDRGKGKDETVMNHRPVQHQKSQTQERKRKDMGTI